MIWLDLAALAHLSKRPEVSFDTILADDNPFIEGCYRLPGRLWEVMIFTRVHVPELRWLPSHWDSGITGTVFHIPVDVKVSVHGPRVTWVQRGAEVRAEAGGRASPLNSPKTRPSKCDHRA